MGRMRSPNGDDGVTLAELMVGMALMAVVGAVSTAGIVQVFRAVGSFQGQTVTGQQLVQIFQRLDREVRYASAISQPATVNGDYYVEYLTTSGSSPTCTELRLSTSLGQLQRRTWPSGSVTAVTAWAPLASQVSVINVNGQVTPPFVLLAATPVLNYERLQIALNSTDGIGNKAVSRQSTVTWAAMNAGLNPATTVCIEGRTV
jgi:prepilin-type N-terminal cleavage/methylation domain-containing protein